MADEKLLWLRALLSGEKCPGCGENTTGGTALICNACESELIRASSEVCLDCGTIYYGCLCAPPILRDVGVELLIKLAAYHPDHPENAFNRLLMRQKNMRDFMLARNFAQRLSVHVRRVLTVRGIPPENCVVTFVPRSRSKIRETGSDQARELARRLAEILGVRFLLLLERTRDGGQQKSLNYRERERNVLGLYRAREDLPEPETVLLVDDIVTSGATMAEAARVLFAAGAGAVIGVCEARTAARGGNETKESNGFPR